MIASVQRAVSRADPTYEASVYKMALACVKNEFDAEDDAQQASQLPIGALMDYGYEGPAVFPFTMKRNKLPSIAASMAVNSKARA